MNGKLLNLIGFAGLVAGLFTATPVHAMFGKHSGSRSHPSRGYRLSSGHEATAVGVQPGPSAYPRYRNYAGTYVAYGPRPYYYYQPWYAVGPTGAVVVEEGVVHRYPDRRDVYEYEDEKRADPFEIYRFELGASLGAGAQPDGQRVGMFGLNLLVDWRSLGIDVRYDDVGFESGSGAFNSVDHVKLLNATMTFALIDGQHGRLRAHIGAFSAFAPEATFVGPGGGLSLSLDLFGPFTAEGSAQAVVFPFTQFDTRAAVGLRLGAIEGRLGWRYLLLDDQGRLGGDGTPSISSGPYVGALIRI
jgi:hypothetical protein